MNADHAAVTGTPRDRIVSAVAELLTEGGREAVLTRTISTAAGVQPPAIYRLFGDKQGLLDAVASHGMATYLNNNSDDTSRTDPVEDLRRCWNKHIDFGLTEPALYLLAYSGARPGTPPPAAVVAAEAIAGHIRRIAAAGRLRVSENRATQLVYAAVTGTTLTLIHLPEERRDRALSRAARAAVIATVTSELATAAPPGPASAAVTLHAVLEQTAALTTHEKALMAGMARPHRRILTCDLGSAGTPVPRDCRWTIRGLRPACAGRSCRR